MLGIIGFLSAAIAFSLYGYSSFKLSKKSKNFDHTNYFWAYQLTALACIVWAFSIQGSILNLASGVLIGDMLLLLASVLLLTTLFKPSQELAIMAIGSLTSLVVIYLRINSSELDPIIRDGILVFNTPRLFGAILAIVLVLIWLKANMNFYERAISPKISQLLRPQYYTSNLLGLIGVVGFLIARKNLTIVLSFSLIVLVFLFLLLLNNYVLSLPKKVVRRGK